MREGTERPCPHSPVPLSPAVAIVVLASILSACGRSAAVKPADGRGDPMSSTTVVASPSTRVAQHLDGRLRSLHFINTSTGLALTSNPAHLLLTVDGGHHWTDVSPPGFNKPGTFPYGVGNDFGAFLTSRLWWVALSTGSRVAVYRTEDAGRHWSRAGPTLGGQSVALFFLNANDGWLETSLGVAAGSQQASIYATTDGGTDWRLMSTDSLTNPSGGSPGALPAGCDKTGISFASSALGWATLSCNAGGIGLAGTSNGGRSWDRRFHIPPVSGVDSGGATTSQPVFSSPSSGALGVLPAAGPGGGRATIYSTSDSGANWVPHQPPGQGAGSPSVVDTVSASTWVIGCGRTVFATTDRGQGWTTRHSDVNLSSHQVDFVSARVGWAWISGMPVSSVLRTVDGGRTWHTAS